MWPEVELLHRVALSLFPAGWRPSGLFTHYHQLSGIIHISSTNMTLWKCSPLLETIKKHLWKHSQPALISLTLYSHQWSATVLTLQTPHYSCDTAFLVDTHSSKFILLQLHPSKKLKLTDVASSGVECMFYIKGFCMCTVCVVMWILTPFWSCELNKVATTIVLLVSYIQLCLPWFFL